MDRRQEFQQLTRHTDAPTIAEAVAAAKCGSAEGRLQLTAAMAWVAYSCPDACEAVYDNIATAWLGTGPTPDVPHKLPEAPLEESFWKAFWAVVDGYDEGYDALSITVAVASLGTTLHEDFIPIAENQARNHPGAIAALTNEIPGYTDMQLLENCPRDSMGYALYRLIVDNGYDPEVLSRDDIGLHELPPVLHYLNARILHMHEVWHLVAGYETTASGEIAISGFQLAQFGHNYSSIFLAVTAAISTFKEPRGFTILMQIMIEGWVHGRDAPALMNIEWEQEWKTSLPDIRDKYGIQVLDSVFPSDLLEAVEDAPFWRKILVYLKLLRFVHRLRQTANTSQLAMEQPVGAG